LWLSAVVCKPVQRIDNNLCRRIKTESHRSRAKIIVDRFRNTNDGKPLLHKLQSSGESAISTSADESLNSLLAQICDSFIHEFGRNLPNTAFSNFG
jgi:hypothetical protein